MCFLPLFCEFYSTLVTNFLTICFLYTAPIFIVTPSVAPRLLPLQVGTGYMPNVLVVHMGTNTGRRQNFPDFSVQAPIIN